MLRAEYRLWSFPVQPHAVRCHRSLCYFLKPDEPNLFRYLKQNGYDVYWYGKNDLLRRRLFPIV
jgi:hypothetical protein